MSRSPRSTSNSPVRSSNRSVTRSYPDDPDDPDDPSEPTRVVSVAPKARTPTCPGNGFPETDMRIPARACAS